MLNIEPKHNSGREVTVRALIRKLTEIGSVTRSDNRATDCEGDSRPLFRLAFISKCRNKTGNVTRLYVNFRNVECRPTYITTFSKKGKLVSV